MRRSGDIAERLARIEDRMATRDDVAELREAVEALGPPSRRRLGGTLLGAVLFLGLLALALAYTR